MGIYDHSELIYEMNSKSILNCIEDNNKFFSSITEGSVVISESAISDLFDKVKDTIDKIIAFLKSLPGKLRNLIEKFLGKKKNTFTNGWPDSDNFNASKEYEGELYDYREMVKAIFELVPTPSQVSFDNPDKNKELDEKYKGISEEIDNDSFKKKYEFKNKTAKNIKENYKTFEDVDKDINKYIGYINDIEKEWEAAKKTNKAQEEHSKQSGDDEYRAKYLSYSHTLIHLSSCVTSMCMQVISLNSLAMAQAISVERFLQSCYPNGVFHFNSFEPGK